MGRELVVCGSQSGLTDKGAITDRCWYEKVYRKEVYLFFLRVNKEGIGA